MAYVKSHFVRALAKGEDTKIKHWSDVTELIRSRNYKLLLVSEYAATYDIKHSPDPAIVQLREVLKKNQPLYFPDQISVRAYMASNPGTIHRDLHFGVGFYRSRIPGIKTYKLKGEMDRSLSSQIRKSTPMKLKSQLSNAFALMPQFGFSMKIYRNYGLQLRHAWWSDKDKIQQVLPQIEYGFEQMSVWVFGIVAATVCIVIEVLVSKVMW